MGADDCLSRARSFAESLQEKIRHEGVFYRNLPAKEVVVRYQSKTAEFGYRIKCGKWTDSSDGLSVNASDCCSLACSIKLAGRNDNHVAEIRLKELGHVTGLELYAKYDPVASPSENPCHFLILPKKDLPEDLVIALKRLDDEIPKERPHAPGDLAIFNQARARLDSAMTLHRDVGLQ